MKYRVYVQNVVSSVVEVDADDPEAAIAAAYQSDDMPGSITYGAFGAASVDESDWEPHRVYDEADEVVWTESTGTQRPLDEPDVTA